MKKSSTVTHLLAFIALVSCAQAATVQSLWVQRYDGPGHGGDNAFASAVDGSGSVFVTGSSPGTNGYADYVTMKYSSAGVPLWTNRYHGLASRNDESRAIALDGSGNVIVTGKSAGGGNSDDYATIKYSNAGVPLWTNRYSTLGDSSSANDVRVDSSGNVFVTGYTFYNGWATIKYSSLGVPLWTNRYAGPATYNHARALAVDGSGKVFVTGFSRGSGSGDDYATVAYSNTGVPLWTNRYNGPGNGDDFAYDIALDGNGKVFVTGGSMGTGGSAEYATIAYSNTGVPLWTNRYKGPGNSLYSGAGEVAVDGSGNVIVTGTSAGIGTYGDWATIKYSNAGVALWTNRYEGLHDDAVNGLAVDGSGNVFVTGYRTDGYSLRFDVVTIAYSSGGAILWSQVYYGTGSGDDSGNAIAADGKGDVLVTGYSVGTNGYADIFTIKYGIARPPLNVQRLNDALILSWTNSTFRLQSAPALSGVFTNMAGATSPYTHQMSGSQQYFRLYSD